MRTAENEDRWRGRACVVHSPDEYDLLSVICHLLFDKVSLFIIALLIVAGVVFLLIELFITPGFGIAGILSAACLLYANYAAFAYVGLSTGLVTLLVTLVVCIAAVVWFMRSKTLDRLSLKKDITSHVERAPEGSIRVGDRGVSVTRLALIGQAEIGGQIVEVKSADGFLDEKTPIVVVRLDSGQPIVQRAEDKQE